MPTLNFNPYYALPVYSTVENGPQFPFNNGQIVTVKLQFGTPILVTDDRRLEEDLRAINAKMEVSLLPEGDEIDDEGYYIVSEVVTPNQDSFLLRFPCDVNDILQAVIVDDDAETIFPLTAGQIVKAALVVTRVKPFESFVTSSLVGEALLSPFGEEVGGLVLAEVELVE